MDHILCRIRDVKPEVIKDGLAKDAAKYSKEGLIMRHIWTNDDDPDETLFIFTAADLQRARKFIETQHSRAREANPYLPLPEVVYLKGVG